jgi:serine/threonine protein kinase/tetratricopeptide (TPR) repeat protein
MLHMVEHSIFIEALEREDPAERAAYLDQACGRDPALRRRLERLLQRHQQAESFLESPALVATVSEPIRQLPGTMIGPYKVLEQIGEGGFGVVFLAEQQQPLHRLVALKVLKPGLDSRQVIARFEAEQQALSLMDHPHIAKVLDAGATEAPGSPSAGSGRPYFVMELVKGVPLTRYCDEARLSVRERLELFLPVCQAVQHAHQKGVIHRDLKPSNILVALYDGKPVPKVIDFGVAKAIGRKLTEHALFTAFGTMVGTLEYMAPEQAERNHLNVDTRADIYSLGVVLYELLTGTTPLERHRLQEVALGEMLRLIQEQEPPKPSTRLSQSQTLPSVAAARQVEPRRLCQLLQGELDWVVMKALAKERDRRYETANALAADIGRYLRDEPVLAGPPGAGYRLRKLVRRHWGKVMAGAGMLALLLAGVVGSTWQAVRATRAEQAATAALAAEMAALTAETAAKAQARQALDTLTDDVVQTLFAKQPVLGEAEKAFLRKVLESYEAFTRQAGDSAEARALQARGFFRVAVLRARLGAQPEAEAAYRQSLALWESLAAEAPEAAEYRSGAARCHNALANLLGDLGRRGEAEAAYRRALTVWEQLAADFPDSPEYRDGLAIGQSNLGILLKHLGRLAEAEAALRRAVALNEQLAADYPTTPQQREHLAICFNNLGNVVREQEKYAEAEASHRRALALQQQLAAESPAAPAYRKQLASSYHNLALALRRLEKYAEAEAALHRAVALNEQLAAECPAVPKYRSALADSQSELGQVLRLERRLPEAEAAWRRAVDLYQKLVAEFPAVPGYRIYLANSLTNIGLLLYAQHRPADALPWYDQAVALLERLHRQELADPTARQIWRVTYWSRAKALDKLKRHREAQADWDQAVELSAPADRPTVQLPRARSRLWNGNVVEALADVEAVTQDPATPGRWLYGAACVYALAAALPDGAGRRETSAGRALTLLRRAQSAGFFKDRGNLDQLKHDADLEALRPRGDFQRLVAELKAAAAKP